MADSPEIIHARSVRLVEALTELSDGIATLEETFAVIDKEEAEANLPPELQKEFFKNVKKLAEMVDNS